MKAVAVLVAAGLLVACGSDGDATPAATSTSAAPTSTTTTTEPPTSATTTTQAPSTTVDGEPERPAPTTTTEAPSTPTPCVDELDLRSTVALLVWPAAEPRAWDDVVDAVEDHDVGGVILMGPRDWTEAEIAGRLADLEARSRHGLVVSTDEEGGDVQRLRVLGILPSQRSIAQDLGDDPTAIRELVATHGERVRALGIDVVFGPVVDVEPVEGEVPLAPSRFFSGGPDEVVAVAEAYLDGWADADLIATLKHFPGHGAASGDTHDVDGVTPSIEALRDRDLVPYERLGDRVATGDVAVMVGHLTVPGLTDGLPATQSAPAIDLLRSLPGYADALLVTDALGMAAVQLPEPEAAVAALAAGIDVALFTQTSQTGPVIDAIVEAVADEVLDEDAVRRSASKVMSLLERDGHGCDAPAV